MNGVNDEMFSDESSLHLTIARKTVYVDVDTDTSSDSDVHSSSDDLSQDEFDDEQQTENRDPTTNSRS